MTVVIIVAGVLAALVVGFVLGCWAGNAYGFHNGWDAAVQSTRDFMRMTAAKANVSTLEKTISEEWEKANHPKPKEVQA